MNGLHLNHCQIINLSCDINKRTNENIDPKTLIQNYGNIKIENISLIEDIENHNLKSKLNISKNLLIEPSFIRLLKISISLSGVLEKPNFYIDTNIENFHKKK